MTTITDIAQRLAPGVNLTGMSDDAAKHAAVHARLGAKAQGQDPAYIDAAFNTLRELADKQLSAAPGVTGPAITGSAQSETLDAVRAHADQAFTKWVADSSKAWQKDDFAAQSHGAPDLGAGMQLDRSATTQAHVDAAHTAMLQRSRDAWMVD